jgi:hypothetical protein
MHVKTERRPPRCVLGHWIQWARGKWACGSAAVFVRKLGTAKVVHRPLLQPPRECHARCTVGPQVVQYLCDANLQVCAKYSPRETLYTHRVSRNDYFAHAGIRHHLQLGHTFTSLGSTCSLWIWASAEKLAPMLDRFRAAADHSLPFSSTPPTSPVGELPTPTLLCTAPHWGVRG